MYTDQRKKTLRLGIVGGGPNSWIGHVHRIAARFDNQYTICAGVFSRNATSSRKFARNLGISKDRCYSNYNEMSEKESLRKDGIEVVSIMTPPGSHQIIAEKFIKKNIHIISDKPFAGDLIQAKKLYRKIKSNKNIKYTLTHNYSSYPMVREAKNLIKNGKIGKIEFINVEYVQDWAGGVKIDKENIKKILGWKIEKKYVGISAVLNEIGSHAYHLAIYISGLKGNKVLANINQISKKLKVDESVRAMIDFNNGAKGIFWASTLAKGGVYGLRIRIFGSKGSVEWVQNDPGYLKFNPSNKAVRFLEKGFYDTKFSKQFTKLDNCKCDSILLS